MKIGTRVKLASIITVCVFLAYGGALLYMDRTMSHLAREVSKANEFSNKITLLRTLTQDYLLYRTERARKQWAAVFDEVSRLVDSKEYRELRHEYYLGDVADKVKIVGDIFKKLMTIPAGAGRLEPEAEINLELRNRLTTQLLLTTQDLLNRFANLSENVNEDLIRTQRLASLLDMSALLILGLMVIGAAIFLQRSVVKPIIKLHEGTEIIGAGNLDHKVGIDTRDEIGQLSRAFDQMTANLKELTLSLKKSEETLRALTSQILKVQEEERGRLARDLHDDLGQSLLVLKMQLSAILRRYSLEPELQQSLQEVSAYLMEVINKTRRLSQDLSPSTLENLGLSEALRNLFDDFQRHLDHEMVIKAEMDEVKHFLSKEATITIYRITQEFLANVHKHAEASRVDVAIRALPEKVTVTLKDNGKGFDLEEIRSRPKELRGMGVVSMEERLRMLGSQFSLTSQPGRGTLLYFEIFHSSGQKAPEIPELP
jgi:signal transduction histidine kinase